MSRKCTAYEAQCGHVRYWIKRKIWLTWEFLLTTFQHWKVKNLSLLTLSRWFLSMLRTEVQLWALTYEYSQDNNTLLNPVPGPILVHNTWFIELLPFQIFQYFVWTTFCTVCWTFRRKKITKKAILHDSGSSLRAGNGQSEQHGARRYWFFLPNGDGFVIKNSDEAVLDEQVLKKKKKIVSRKWTG